MDNGDMNMVSGESTGRSHPRDFWNQVSQTSTWSLVSVQTTGINTDLCHRIGHKTPIWPLAAVQAIDSNTAPVAASPTKINIVLSGSTDHRHRPSPSWYHRP